MARWRGLEEYTPFARTLVEYMWEQRPPLVPNQFAERLGVRKQALSTWLNSDAVPTPPVVVRLARGMGHPVRDLMTAAGYAPADDPLLDVVDAWAYVCGEVERALGAAGAAGTTGWMEESEEVCSGAGGVSTEVRAVLLPLLHELADRALADRALVATMARDRLPVDSVDGGDPGTSPAFLQTNVRADAPSS
jgi:transcriptional regulator with XRE-family HTH domain